MPDCHKGYGDWVSCSARSFGIFVDIRNTRLQKVVVGDEPLVPTCPLNFGCWTSSEFQYNQLVCPSNSSTELILFSLNSKLHGKI